MTRVYIGAGTWASAGEKTGWIKLYERGSGIDVVKSYETVQLTVDEARSLARQLYRLARRVENNSSQTS